MRYLCKHEECGQRFETQEKLDEHIVQDWHCLCGVSDTRQIAFALTPEERTTGRLHNLGVRSCVWCYALRRDRAALGLGFSGIRNG
jgi:hypothetical protein